MTTKYHVIPRYSCGSPAMVDAMTAKRVMANERRAFPGYLEGIYGNDGKILAMTEGLEGVVLTQNGTSFVDAITGRQYGDVPYESIRHPGTLVVVVKGRKAKYFYRRQLVGEFPEKNQDDNIRGVATILHEKYGFDVFSKEMNDLWKSQTRMFR